MARLILMHRSRPTFLARHHGLTIMELMVVAGLFAFVLSAVLGLLGNAQTSFFTADAAIDVRNNLRNASERIAMELRNTGYQGGVGQFTLSDNSGTGGSDIIRFSIPVLCSSTSTLLDANGNPAYWRAPLTWGCNSYTCMDADGSCATVEYKHIQYLINASNQLERRVLNNALAVVNGSTTVVANNISNFQITLSADTRIITFVLTGQKTAPTGRVVTATYGNDVLLNNLGG